MRLQNTAPDLQPSVIGCLIIDFIHYYIPLVEEEREDISVKRSESTNKKNEKCEAGGLATSDTTVEYYAVATRYLAYVQPTNVRKFPTGHKGSALTFLV